MPQTWPPRFVERLRAGAAQALIAAGVSQWALTGGGLLLACLSGWLFYGGWFAAGGAALFAAGACDFLDGEVARRRGGGTAFGAFLDSTVDRLSDAAPLGGIMLHYSQHQADKYVALAFAAMVGSFLVSYARARAEGLKLRCETGILQRPERILLLSAAGLMNAVRPALWVLAVLSAVTAVQRILYVRRSIAETGSRAGTDP